MIMRSFVTTVRKLAGKMTDTRFLAVFERMAVGPKLTNTPLSANSSRNETLRIAPSDYGA